MSKGTTRNKDNQAIELPKIMTKPLPMILDELESYIQRVEEAVGVAQQAARDSQGAAAQAKESGEKAADAAKKAAETAVANIREDFKSNTDTLLARIMQLESDMKNIKEAVIQEASALDKAFQTLKTEYRKDSPWLQDKRIHIDNHKYMDNNGS